MIHSVMVSNFPSPYLFLVLNDNDSSCRQGLHLYIVSMTRRLDVTLPGTRIRNFHHKHLGWHFLDSYHSRDDSTQNIKIDISPLSDSFCSPLKKKKISKRIFFSFLKSPSSTYRRVSWLPFAALSSKNLPLTSVYCEVNITASTMGPQQCFS